MGSRRLHAREREREDHLVGRPAPAVSTISTIGASRPATVNDHLLSLQGAYGNAAVATVVQRKERPQSTDAPGRKPPPKKKPPAEDFAPTQSNAKFSDWPNARLAERAAQELDSKVQNSWHFAAELYLELWFRTKSRATAIGPYKAYKKLGDAKRAEYWLGVMQGTIKPGQKKTGDDQAGKEF